jgi:hypothetical protein
VSRVWWGVPHEARGPGQAHHSEPWAGRARRFGPALPDEVRRTQATRAALTALPEESNGTAPLALESGQRAWDEQALVGRAGAGRALAHARHARRVPPRYARLKRGPPTHAPVHRGRCLPSITSDDRPILRGFPWEAPENLLLPAH